VRFVERRIRIGAALGIGAALPMLCALADFMVDDAWVTARYASNLASGGGYALNAGDAATDGVTPLGFAWLLAPFARGAQPVVAAFVAAKWLGAVAWLVGAGCLGAALASLGGSRRRYLALLLVAASAPLGAWAVAGMETGLVTGLAALAVASRALGRERSAWVAASLVAAWRPELVPWAVSLALAPSRDAERQGVDAGVAHAAAQLAVRLRALAVVLLPVLGVALCRWGVFGSPLPLSFRAKAPSLPLGGSYALACFLLSGVVAMCAWRRLAPWARGLGVAVLVHFVAVALAGGDWMPLSRLVVPVLPAAFLVAGAALAVGGRFDAALRVGLALAGELFAVTRAGGAAATVGEKRRRTLEELAPHLAGRTAATVDAGWVGAAATRVVDLAGITDPAVAALPGGHTSKRIPSGFLDARDVDALVLLLAPGKRLEPRLEDTPFARWTELHVVHLPGVAARFCVVAESHEPHYAVLHRCTE